MFLQAVKAAELDDDGPIHAALVPVPELAYLAAPPGALRDPPRRSRLARVVDDE
jgi:hypothetical protein